VTALAVLLLAGYQGIPIMRLLSFRRTTITAFCLLAGFVNPVRSDEPKKPATTDPATPAQARKSVERALGFMVKDAAEWRKDRQCATCHHGTMTVWVLSEAKARGYEIEPESFAEIVKWTKGKLEAIDKPRDTRLGWNMVNTPAVYLAMMALAIPDQKAVSADELKQIVVHLVRHQETDGSWAWSIAPAKNRPPPVFESDEVVTLMARMTLAPHAPPGMEEKSDAGKSRDKSAAWLEKAKPTNTTQAQAIRLFADVQAGRSEKELRSRIDGLLGRQNRDGGWGQDKDLPSDAFATGQALYFLGLAGVKPDRAEIRRGVSFLVATQKDDGSWPMTSRAHPGETPMKNPVPITYFGSSWATLGLLRSVPK
jgi:squalene-hopene/tetraprenyl-beta-curcumene cyclase